MDVRNHFRPHRILSFALFLLIAAVQSYDAAAESTGGKLDGQKPLSADQERDLGIDTEFLDRLEKIADAYRRRGFYSHAEAVIPDVFEIRRKKRGADDAEIAYYPNSLGLLQAEQGKYSDAEKHYLRAIAITEKHWGPNYPDVGDQLNNLAGVYRAQARFAEAESLYQRSIVIWEKYSGADDANVAVALNNLGGLYALQSRYALAEAWKKHWETTIRRSPRPEDTWDTLSRPKE